MLARGHYMIETKEEKENEKYILIVHGLSEGDTVHSSFERRLYSPSFIPCTHFGFRSS